MRIFAEQEIDEAIKVFDREKAEGKLTALKGSIADLLQDGTVKFITVGDHDIYR